MGNKRKITSRFYIFDKWSSIWRPLATWDPVTSYQSSDLTSSKHPWLLQSHVWALQSQRLKSLNDSSGRPTVPMAAAGGLGEKMIGKKKSNVGQHKWGKAVRSESGARSPFPWLELMARTGSWFKSTPEGKVRLTSWLKVRAGSEGKNKSLLEVSGTELLDWLEFWRWASLPWLLVLKSQEEDKSSLFKDHQASQTLKMDPLITLDPVLWGRGPSHLSLLVSRYWVGWHSRLAPIHHETRNP